MTIEQILEIIENYKLRMPPTVFYELKADIVNFEEPTIKNDSSELEKNSKKLEKGTTKNDLGVENEERELALMYLEQIKEDYIEGVGYERHPLPEYYAIETAIKSLALPSVTPQLSVSEVTALTEWTEKLTKASEDAYNKGYEAGMKAQEQEPQTFKWCTDCKEYDQEKHCCHRWSKVIRDTVEEMKQEQDPILDKIRAEIEQARQGYEASMDYTDGAREQELSWVLDVIDKYKAETEGT